METRDKIIENLKDVYDPEISINVFDLGLIYDINLEHLPKVTVTHTLTSAFCPAADMIVNDVKGAALTVEDVIDCQVEVTFNPAWDPSRLTEEGHAYLNYMYSDHMD